MSSPQRPGRRIPPKSRGVRPATPSDPTSSPDEWGEPAAAGIPGSAAVRPGSRAANRAAKRATTGVRPKTGIRGRPGGRRGRSSSSGLILLAIGAVAIGAAVLLIGNPFGSPAASGSPSPAAGVSQAAVQSHGDGTCPKAQPAPLGAGQVRDVTIETPKGNIVIRVQGGLSQIAAGNFVALAACKFYDGIVFHRTASLEDGTPFVIQGGDPLGTGGGGPGYTIADEPVVMTYHRGTVAMARTQQPNSQGSQFFIVLDDKAAPALSSANTYAILGEVISGMDVADAIYQASGGAETPASPIPMTKVTVSTPAASPGPATGAPSASAVPASVAPTETIQIQ